MTVAAWLSWLVQMTLTSSTKTAGYPGFFFKRKFPVGK